ncbi:hypothetical protein P0F65_10825 [Sphingomonas sp. I4]
MDEIMRYSKAAWWPVPPVKTADRRGIPANKREHHPSIHKADERKNSDNRSIFFILLSEYPG